MKLIDKIWESDLFAYYNEQTGEIKAKSRIAYLHEEGHSKQSKKLIFFTCFWCQMFTTVIGFLALFTGEIMISLMAGIPALLLTYLEFDAWIYCFKNLKK